MWADESAGGGGEGGGEDYAAPRLLDLRGGGEEVWEGELDEEDVGALLTRSQSAVVNRMEIVFVSCVERTSMAITTYCNVPTLTRHACSKTSMSTSVREVTPETPHVVPALRKRMLGWPICVVTTACRARTWW